MDARKRNLFLADLIGYKIQRDIEATKKLEKLAEDKGFLSHVVNSARKSSSATGITLDTVLSGIESALTIDIFTFKLNGVDVFKLMDEQMSKGAFELEVWMNPMYFSSEIALRHAVMPGFRKPQITEEYINERMKRAGQAWLFQFEKNIKDYVNIPECKKTILEE